MIITNKLGLSEELYSAISNDQYDLVGDISVTSLLNPPQIEALKYHHYDDIETDASDLIWALLGSSVHSMIDRMETQKSLVEERLTIEIDGWTISGKPDLYTSKKKLKDFKITSAWTLIYGDRLQEWTQQLNCYAFMLRRHGFEVESAEIECILRDWSKLEAKRNPKYPQSQVQIIPIRVWAEDIQEGFIRQRVSIHQEARESENLSASHPCSDADRWSKPDKYAVMKAGRKTALRVLDSKKDAQDWVNNNKVKCSPNVEIQHRPGEDVRCENYCPVRDFCQQYKQFKGDSSNEE